MTTDIPSAVAATERAAVSELADAAEHRFNRDTFDLEAARDAMHALERSGATPGVWIVPAGAVADLYGDAVTDPPTTGEASLDGVPLYEHDADLLGDRAICVGERAVTLPPVAVPGRPVIVRHPRGVAMVGL